MIIASLPQGKRKFFGGIDPGLHGAIAVVDKRGEMLYMAHLPMRDIRAGTRTEQEPDVARLAKDMLEAFPSDESLVLCEEPISVHGQGLGSTSLFKYQAGLVVGALYACGYNVIRVYPVEWKRAMNLIGRIKRDSVQVANQLWPGQKITDHNMAEAGLIAEWLRRLCASGRFPDVDV